MPSGSRATTPIAIRNAIITPSTGQLGHNISSRLIRNAPTILVPAHSRWTGLSTGT
ncbi:Uncharacterised protein [Mycobacteroides abscessus subsp. abscessus]|nr:Uncharacterised protein [Mycobacteroides abscessus subsp. abscessus]